MNKYGYRYNLNHPAVNRWYTAFLQEKGVPRWVGLTDGQRKELEADILDPLWQQGKLPSAAFAGSGK